MSMTFLRSLRKTPGPSLLAIAALGLGLGSCLALFALLDRLLVHPLPYPGVSRIRSVWIKAPAFRKGQLSGHAFGVLSAQPGPFEAVGALGICDSVLQGFEAPQPLHGARVSGQALPLLGIQPLAGRLFFTPEEDRLEGPGAVILSWELWRNRFGGDPGVVGRALSLGGRSCTVVGILPERFMAPTSRLGRPQIILPIGFKPQECVPGAGADYEVVGRLKPGIPLDQVDALLAPSAQALEPGRRFFTTSLAGDRSAPYRERLEVLAGAVALLLAAVCANACGLLLARFEDRRGILALHGVLGASPMRLALQVLGEGAAFGLLGTLAGLVLDAPLRAFLATQMGLAAPPPQPLGCRLLAVALGLFTGLLAALLPAWKAARNEPLAAVQEAGGRSSVRSASRKGLIALEVALSFLLLTGSGTLLNALWAQLRRGPGFDPSNLYVTTIPMPVGSRGKAAAWAEGLSRRLRMAPGVEGAFAGLPLPLYSAGGDGDVGAAGTPRRGTAFHHYVEGDFCGTLGLRLLEGRTLAPGEGSATVISRPLARALFPEGGCVGRVLEADDQQLTVVGVVEGTREHGLEEPIRSQYFLGVPKTEGLGSLNLVVRSRAGLPLVREQVRAALKELDPEAAAWEPKPFSLVLERVTADQRRAAYSLSLLAGVSALLATLGLYGLLRQLFRLRQREMGIRSALGASPVTLAWQVGTTALRMLLWGLSAGLVGTLGLSRVLGHGFSGAGLDAGTLAGAGFFLALGTALACVSPALTASRTQPSRILREG